MNSNPWDFLSVMLDKEEGLQASPSLPKQLNATTQFSLLPPSYPIWSLVLTLFFSQYQSHSSYPVYSLSLYLSLSLSLSHSLVFVSLLRLILCDPILTQTDLYYPVSSQPLPQAQREIHLPIIFGALRATGEHHWHTHVRAQATALLQFYHTIDDALYTRCLQECRVEEEEARKELVAACRRGFEVGFGLGVGDVREPGRGALAVAASSAKPGVAGSNEDGREKGVESLIASAAAAATAESDASIRTDGIAVDDDKELSSLEVQRHLHRSLVAALLPPEESD